MEFIVFDDHHCDGHSNVTVMLPQRTKRKIAWSGLGVFMVATGSTLAWQIYRDAKKPKK